MWKISFVLKELQVDTQNPTEWVGNIYEGQGIELVLTIIPVQIESHSQRGQAHDRLQ